jgi:hypothetical protein
MSGVATMAPVELASYRPQATVPAPRLEPDSTFYTSSHFHMDKVRSVQFSRLHSPSYPPRPQRPAVLDRLAAWRLAAAFTSKV